ncbi:MAG TPA: DUF2344 domain-containing protein [Firmicutes bacterium]|nr:DUF2344 domain-containing protein [Candidatus Fermentithermobacillaceae bacterium]
MKIRVKYCKGDSVRFLSHLDVARVIQMSLRRAGWPVAMTQGFSPKPKISFYAPLPVGTAGEDEYFDVVLDSEKIPGSAGKKGSGKGQGRIPTAAGAHGDVIDLKELRSLARALSDNMPPGFSVKGVSIVSDQEESLEEKISASEYEVDIKGVEKDSLVSAVDAFLREHSVLFQIQRPKETKDVDLRPYVLDMDVKLGKPEPEERAFITMKIKHDAGRTIRPQWVLACLSRFGLQIDPREAVVDRKKVYLD